MKNQTARIQVIEIFLYSVMAAALGFVLLFPDTAASWVSALNGLARTGQPQVAAAPAPCTWWDNIGGCGVSGGAGGGGGGGRWIGRGVTGGLVNAELTSNTTIAGDFEYKSFSARLSGDLTPRNNLGLTLPWSSKTGTYQFRDDNHSNTQKVGGFGDMGLQYSRKFGSTDAGSATLALGFPTGKYDHRRYDPDHPRKSTRDTLRSFVTPELQAGTGMFSNSITLDYSMDKDWGPIMFGVSYTAMAGSYADLLSNRHWGGQNDIWTEELMDWDLGLPAVEKQTVKRWYDNNKPAGMNDYDSVYVRHYYHVKDKDGKDLGPLQGDFAGDAVGMNCGAGLKQEGCVHSLFFTYSYKLAPDWYLRRVDVSTAALTENNIKDYDAYTQTHLLTPVIREENRHAFSLTYGLEISSDYFPIFLSGTMAFGPKEIQSFTGTMAVKGSFF